jgi:hypothetical protein
MSRAFEELVRDSMKWQAAGIELPAGLAGRARRRHRRRRLAQFAAVAAGGAGAAAAVAAMLAVPAGGRVTGHPGEQTTAYVIRRVDGALASGDLVMRETVSLRDQFSYEDGSRSYQAVTWSYRADMSTLTFGARGQLQADDGTALVDGRPRPVSVDYIRRTWELSPAIAASGPAKPCTLAGFLAAGSGYGLASSSWPSLIRQELGCGRYQVAGSGVVDGVRTIKLTGSMVIENRIPSLVLRFVNTIFVDPATYLPVRVWEYAVPVASPRMHSVPSSADFRWLPATAASTSEALVTIPAGYQQVQG